MRAPGRDRDLEQRGRFAETIEQTERATRFLALRVDFDAGLAADAARHARRVDLRCAFRPAALDESQIAFLDEALAQQLMEHSQRAALLGEQQTTRSAAIEPMRELEVLAVG